MRFEYKHSEEQITITYPCKEDTPSRKLSYIFFMTSGYSPNINIPKIYSNCSFYLNCHPLKYFRCGYISSCQGAVSSHFLLGLIQALVYCSASVTGSTPRITDGLLCHCSAPCLTYGKTWILNFCLQWIIIRFEDKTLNFYASFYATKWLPGHDISYITKIVVSVLLLNACPISSTYIHQILLTAQVMIFHLKKVKAGQCKRF